MCCRYYILPKDVAWDPIREGAEHARVMRRFREAGLSLKCQGELRPADLAPVLATNREGGQSYFPMRWGFRLEGKGGLLINARSETAAWKPSFREAWRSHRCAVPASGYYEWSHSAEGAGTRYAVEAPDASMLWLCGLYRMEAGLPVFVILTRSPGAALGEIHDRMPLILPPEALSRWVDPGTDPASLLGLAVTELLPRAAC